MILFLGRIFLFLGLTFLFLGPITSQAEIKSRTKAGWDKSDENSQIKLAHRPWTQLLRKYVKADVSLGINIFDYQNVTEKDKKLLVEYINEISSIDPRELTKKEQFAYWVNLYNSLTVKIILENYPLESIKNIKSHWLSFGPWDKNLVVIDGESFSLNDIQHKILRPIWKNPLTHYALACGAVSCPQVRNRAYTASNSRWMLQTAARQYINNSSYVYFADSNLHLSSMYQWYGDDFSKEKLTLIKHLAHFADNPLRGKLREYRGLIYFEFDWSLNNPHYKN